MTIPSNNNGKNRSLEAIEKTRHANLGRKCSPETKAKMRQVHLGKKRTITPEWREKIRQANLGRKNTPETIERMRLAHNTPEALERAKEQNRQTHNTPEYKVKVSGENSSNWQGGISFEPYCIKWTKELKEKIRNKYERKCFLCGKTEAENGDKKLDVHHVDYDKEQGCNGKKWELVPLCRSCHAKTGSNRDDYEKEILIKLEIQITLKDVQT